VAILKCSPEYAYGGDKTMWFEIEMIGWKEGWAEGGSISPVAVAVILLLLALGFMYVAYQ